MRLELDTDLKENSTTTNMHELTVKIEYALPRFSINLNAEEDPNYYDTNIHPTHPNIMRLELDTHMKEQFSPFVLLRRGQTRSVLLHRCHERHRRVVPAVVIVV